MEKRRIEARDKMGKKKEEEEILEERSVKATRALLQTFLQTVKAFRLYEADHPILNKFLERLKKDFDHYFEEFESFPLLVGEFRLYYRGKIVYENQDLKESLAFYFYRDGIREIKFIRGLEFQEVVNFLNVVRKGESVNRMEDDLVTLLWEQDFSHITFGTVDEFIEHESAYVPATEEDFERKLEFKGLGKTWVEETPDISEPETLDGLRIGGLEEAMGPLPGQSLVQACQLTTEEIEEINREVEAEYAPEYLNMLIDNLIEILLHLGEDIDAYENMISYFERTIASLLERGEIRKAISVLMKLNQTMESIVLKDKQIFAIRRILDTFSSPSAIERLGEAMVRNEEVDSEAVHQYLRLLSPKSVEPLCHLLGRLESGKWRRAICEALVHLSQADIHHLVKFLSDPNPFLVSHILYVLGKIGHPSTYKYLTPLVAHPDPKVREETLQLLIKTGMPAKDLLQKFLKDPLEKIRMKAALAFAKTAGEEAVKPLEAIILSEDFLKKDYEEKASFFRALGETGAEGVISTLKKIAKKRKWFQRKKWEEMRLCAQNTLKMLGVEEWKPKREPRVVRRSLQG